MPTFRLKAKTASLDEVAELYRPAYVEREGAFHLDPEKLEAIDLDDKAELSGALSREREERRRAKSDSEKLRADLEKFKDLDPDKARAALQALTEAEEKKLRDKGKYEEIIKNNEVEYQRKLAEKLKELGERDAQVSAVTAKLRGFTLDNKLCEAALKAGVLPQYIEDVMTLTSRKFDLADDDSIVFASGDEKAAAVTPESFYGNIYKELRPNFYAPTGTSGSGAPAGGTGASAGGSKTAKRADFDQMSPADKAAHIKAGGAITD